MMKLPRLIALLTALAAACLMPGMAAAATSTTAADPISDAIHRHIDIRGVTLLHTDEDVIGIRVNTGILVGGGRMAIYIDIDQNAATGYLGADIAFFYEQYTIGQAMLTGVWNGSSWIIATPQTLQYDPQPFYVSLGISRAELGATTGINVFARGGAMDANGALSESYSDWAPNAGWYSLRFSASTQVGGTSGGEVVSEEVVGGADAIAPPEPLTLTLAQARQHIVARMRATVGAAATVTMTGCQQLSSTLRRCTVVARRGKLMWRGAATVRAGRIEAQETLTFRFAGTRTVSGCTSCTRQVRW